MKKLILLLIIISTQAVASPPTSVNRTAYLKVHRNRIMIFEFSGLVEKNEMLAYINSYKPMHTDGRMTAAYFFPKGSKMPSPAFSSFKTITAGNKFLYESKKIDPWEFAYMQHFNGKKTFVSCMEKPSHTLCRQ